MEQSNIVLVFTFHSKKLILWTKLKVMDITIYLWEVNIWNGATPEPGSWVEWSLKTKLKIVPFLPFPTPFTWDTFCLGKFFCIDERVRLEETKQYRAGNKGIRQRCKRGFKLITKQVSEEVVFFLSFPTPFLFSPPTPFGYTVFRRIEFFNSFKQDS